MATKAELLEQAQEQGLDVNSRTTKAELESKLGQDGENTADEQPQENTPAEGGEQTSGETQEVDTVEVNDNTDGEATNGTTEQGNEGAVENTQSVPQNGVDEIQTLDLTNDDPIAKKADEDRTDEELAFADESNPNQKARNAATDGAEFDQDGNPRTGGYSYGVAADDSDGTVVDEQNKGEAPEKKDEPFTGRVMNQPYSARDYLNPVAGSENDTNNVEWSQEDQVKLEDSLSDLANGVRARVTTSAGRYVRVKFFWNNKPLGTYKSRNYSEGDAVEFRNRLLKERDILGR